MSKVKDPPAVWPLGSSRGAGCGRGPRSLVAPGRRRAAGGASWDLGRGCPVLRVQSTNKIQILLGWVAHAVKTGRRGQRCRDLFCLHASHTVRSTVGLPPDHGRTSEKTTPLAPARLRRGSSRTGSDSKIRCTTKRKFHFFEAGAAGAFFVPYLGCSYLHIWVVNNKIRLKLI